MGTEKLRRGVTGTTASFTGKVTHGGLVAASSGIQSIALSGVSTAAAGTPVAAKTTTALITSTGTGAGHEVALAARPVGSVVNVAVECNSTVPVTLLLESTTQTLFGSTSNGVVFSTNSSGTSVTLQKVSTAAYAILGFNSLSTAARPTIAGSTGTV